MFGPGANTTMDKARETGHSEAWWGETRGGGGVISSKGGEKYIISATIMW